VAKQISEVASKVFCVGLRVRRIAEELLSLGFSEANIYQYEDSVSAGQELQNMLLSGDLVLVKGSQAMRMERTVEEIIRYPKDKKKLLVRQDEGWVSRNE
jgi:UDP-N-acetylmuramyl pentapeptide synthase